MQEYLERNVDNLEYKHRMGLLNIIAIKHNVPVHEHGDGTRVELNKIKTNILKELYDFTFNIIKKNNNEWYISN